VRDFLARNASGVGGSLMRVKPATLRDFPFAYPPLDHQREIVAEIEKQFTRLDAGVAALRRVQANLKRYRAAVLKAACEGRLVPTEAELAKAEGRTYETGEQLLARILADRRKNWHGRGKYKEPVAPDTTNLPRLPEGWTWTNIGQLAEVGTGATPASGNSEFYADGMIPWVTSGAVNSPRVECTDQFVTATALEKCNLTLYPPGTLLLAMYGEGKTRGMASELMFSATTNQALAAIEAPEMLRNFVKVVLWKNYDDVRKSASGGVQPNLNLSLVRAVHVALPPLAEQTRIVAEVERRLSVIEELEAAVALNLQRATRLRQSVLQRAFGRP
jgi:type I restriction enzyme S subunit